MVSVSHNRGKTLVLDFDGVCPLQIEDGGHRRLNFEGGGWDDFDVQTSAGSVIAACAFQP